MFKDNPLLCGVAGYVIGTLIGVLGTVSILVQR